MTAAGLRILRCTADAIEIDGRLSREGPLLVAVALALLGLVPLGAPGPVTPMRLAASASLAALASAMAWGAVGRRRRVAIFPQRGEITLGAARHALSDARRFVLNTSGGAKDAEPRIGYRVELELADGPSITLLESADPAAVLSDLERLLAHVDLPVVLGWALPKGAEPWRERSEAPIAPAAPRQIELKAAPLPSQRRAAITVLGGAVFTTIAMSVMFGTRLRRGDPVAPLSWALAAGTVGLLFAIGTFVATDHVRVRLGRDGILIERRAFGRTRHSRHTAISDLVDAYAVGPSAEDIRHVLVRTRRELFAIPCAGESAAELVAALRRPDSG